MRLFYNEANPLLPSGQWRNEPDESQTGNLHAPLAYSCFALKRAAIHPLAIAINHSMTSFFTPSHLHHVFRLYNRTDFNAGVNHMISVEELVKQRDALDMQIKEARQRELHGAISQVRELVSQHELTVEDVFPAGRGRKGSASTNKVAPKYRDPQTGKTWTGRGKPPLWIAGQNREQFLIA